MEKRTHSDSKRAEILRAAIKLFARKGIDGTSVREIGREAGVSEAALYKHFAGKEAVALAVFVYHAKQATGLIDHCAAQPGPFLPRLEALLAAAITLHDEDPFGLLLLEQRYKFVYQAGVPLRTPLEALKAFIDDGVALGEVPPQDTLLSAALCLGALQRLAAFSDTGSLPARLAPQLPAIQARLCGLLGVR
jgi:AcrR family transcriptional regulator